MIDGSRTMDEDRYRRFLLDDLDIRGACVHLEAAWQQMIAGRGYVPRVAAMLGELTAVAVLLGGQLKHAGRITFQLRGNGPVSLLVIDCSSEQETLRLRGMARADATAARADDAVGGLLGDGQLLMSIDLPESRLPFQSIVPLEGERIAALFERYLQQSEQQAARLLLAADARSACGLFVQKMPDADRRDADGWNRVGHLLDTVQAEELLRLPADRLLQRVFHQETVRVFAPRPVVHHCPEDWDKVRATLSALGRSEIEAILAEQGEILIRDDICNREYRVDSEMATRLLDAAKHSLH
jgi:molecular chaperone Hsp33